MGQLGYTQCGCCGNLYADDGSESDLYEEDHPKRIIPGFGNVEATVLDKENNDDGPE